MNLTCVLFQIGEHLRRNELLFTAYAAYGEFGTWSSTSSARH